MKARRVSEIFKVKIEEKSYHLIRRDIIEKVEFSKRAFPLVAVRKKNSKLRICGDFRLLNNRIENNNFQLPILEEWLQKLDRNSKFFGRVDLKNAFHQFEIDKSCRGYACLTTHLGLYRYKGLPYEIKCGPSAFQQYISSIISNKKAVFLYE